MTIQTIPVLDLRQFQLGNDEAKAAFCSALGGALSDLGFFAVEHHGVDAKLIARAYEQAEALFMLSPAQKRAYEQRELAGQRGYTSFGKEHAKDSAAPDLKEFWHVAREPTRERPSKYGPNLWPRELPEFRAVMSELYAQLNTCATELLRACAVFLNEPEDLIASMARDGETILRIIHYPPVPEDKHPDSVRAAAHEDINLITLLCESTAPGLELLQRDGKWRPIHALEGQIIVDAGDMLQHLTNGYFKSTTHRVINPDNDRERRFSMPFFVHPRSEVDLTPLESCVRRTSARHYPPLSAGELLSQRLAEIGLG